MLHPVIRLRLQKALFRDKWGIGNDEKIYENSEYGDFSEGHMVDLQFNDHRLHTRSVWK
jgi:hypothetical protein